MAADAGPSRGPVVVRLLLRIVLLVTLVVLLALNGVKHAPAIAAALHPSASAPAALGSSAAALSSPPASAATSPSARVSVSASASATPVSTGASGGGAGSGGSGGGGSGGGGSGGGSSASTATHSARPSSTPFAIENLTANDVQCPTPSGGQFATTPPAPTTTVDWTTVGASAAYIGVDTDDAQANPYSQVDPNDDITLDWSCPQASQQYTLTIVSAGGAKTSKSITVRNTGYTG